MEKIHPFSIGGGSKGMALLFPKFYFHGSFVAESHFFSFRARARKANPMWRRVVAQVP